MLLNVLINQRDMSVVAQKDILMEIQKNQDDSAQRNVVICAMNMALVYTAQTIPTQLVHVKQDGVGNFVTLRLQKRL